jgi:hypothetical protein
MRKTLLLVSLLACADSSFAALGGRPADFGAHVMASNRGAVSSASSGYTENEKTLDSGVIVREYVGADGSVFAVSWRGPFQPDMKELLGAYFDTMVAHARQRPKAGHSQLTVKQDDVVIISGGHMGAFMGKAWLPSKLPAGFDLALIK